MDLGMVSRLVDRSVLLDTAVELAQTMNSKNPMGLRLTKEAINMSLDAGGLEQVLNIEDRNQALLVVRGMLGKNEKTSRVLYPNIFWFTVNIEKTVMFF
jgi:enoyl-CoA hydratase/carnithine racemase